MDPKHLSLATMATVSNINIDSPPRDSDKGRLDEQVQLVYFDENDPEDPKNWSDRRKIAVILILCALAFCG